MARAKEGKIEARNVCVRLLFRSVHVLLKVICHLRGCRLLGGTDGGVTGWLAGDYPLLPPSILSPHSPSIPLSLLLTWAEGTESPPSPTALLLETITIASNSRPRSIPFSQHAIFFGSDETKGLSYQPCRRVGSSFGSTRAKLPSLTSFVPAERVS